MIAERKIELGVILKIIGLTLFALGASASIASTEGVCLMTGSRLGPMEAYDLAIIQFLKDNAIRKEQDSRNNSTQLGSVLTDKYKTKRTFKNKKFFVSKEEYLLNRELTGNEISGCEELELTKNHLRPYLGRLLGRYRIIVEFCWIEHWKIENEDNQIRHFESAGYAVENCGQAYRLEDDFIMKHLF